ncbi:MAG: hypothetical protein ABJP44_19610 [Sulfitobacter sp.]|uniref:SGNH/GDSL hydrolase family protein n=1 Tax=Sulfitobacter sp. TaxID=1903071 RepID=UPI0032984E87
MTDTEDGPFNTEQKNRVLEAFERHFNPKDELQYFDPYLSAIGPPTRNPRTTGGYKLWPDEAHPRKPDVTLMTIGNSTSLWPAYPWSLELAQSLSGPDYLVELWHGAGKGNTSSQELMRVLRDAPVIKPDLIISLSGICDIGYLLNAPTHPYLHKYTRKVLDFALEAGIVTRKLVYGPPDSSSPAEVWCRNQRFARLLADELGIKLLTLLQPVQGYGNYPQSAAEKEFYESKAKVVLRGVNKTYGEAVQDFYTEVKSIIAARPEAYSHVVDITDVFDDCPGAYRDHRHQTPLGSTHLAQKILPFARQVIAQGSTS